MDLFTGKWSGNLWFQAMCFGKGYIVAYFEAKVKGIVILKRLPKNYILKVRTPQAVLASKGIEFLTKVNGDTIITVLEGEVGFSDINGKNTVVARKKSDFYMPARGITHQRGVYKFEHYTKMIGIKGEAATKKGGYFRIEELLLYLEVYYGWDKPSNVTGKNMGEIHPKGGYNEGQLCNNVCNDSMCCSCIFN